MLKRKQLPELQSVADHRLKHIICASLKAVYNTALLLASASIRISLGVDLPRADPAWESDMSVTTVDGNLFSNIHVIRRW